MALEVEPRRRFGEGWGSRGFPSGDDDWAYHRNPASDPTGAQARSPLSKCGVVQKAAELTLAIYPRPLWDPVLRQHAQGVSDNAWSSLRAEPKLPSW